MINRRILFVASSILFSLPTFFVLAASIDELKTKIDQHSVEIKRLETEIAGYEKDLVATAKTSSSLQSEIKRLETTNKKLVADIRVTENEIDRADLEIEKISLEIGRKNTTVEERQKALAESLREWRNRDTESLFEVMTSYRRSGDFWNELAQLAFLQHEVQVNIDDLRHTREELEVSKTKTEAERLKLAGLQVRLSEQKIIAEENKADKDRLLKITKNKEANYRSLLSEAKTKKEAFEKELFDFENQLRIAVDPNSIPPAGKGILAWPLDEILVTQAFGKTVDAKRLYVSGTHNGIDFRAVVGTPVKSALSGVVVATGNTDEACAGASYGKWVLIKHDNGLSTLYAHLSLIGVKAGEGVVTGQRIGYSGRTGYATGPHLHFSVYATQGMRVDEYSFRSCTGAKIKMPLAGPEAYLDPLIYL